MTRKRKIRFARLREHVTYAEPAYTPYNLTFDTVAPDSVTISNVRAWDDKGNDISDRIEAVEGGFRLKTSG